MQKILDTTIGGFDRRIEKLVTGSGDLAGSYTILTSIPGIGPVTAAALTAWMGEAAALIGVAPFARDRGTLKGGRHVGGRGTCCTWRRWRPACSILRWRSFTNGSGKGENATRSP
ncbi:MAG: transposase [Rhodobacteraceae bacterium]|nr:transposase [Paracoccaceae bacterium]